MERERRHRERLGELGGIGPGDARALAPFVEITSQVDSNPAAERVAGLHDVDAEDSGGHRQCGRGGTDVLHGGCPVDINRHKRSHLEDRRCGCRRSPPESPNVHPAVTNGQEWRGYLLLKDDCSRVASIWLGVTPVVAKTYTAARKIEPSAVKTTISART